MFLIGYLIVTGVLNVEDNDHKNDQEVTSWKVLSPNAIQVRNVVK